jgi:predicted ATP-binding protein involved in virulence
MSIGGNKYIRFDKEKMLQEIDDIPYFRRMGGGMWMDRRTDEIFDSDVLLNKIMNEFPKFKKNHSIVSGLMQYSKIPTVYFIREQRLLRPVSDDKAISRLRRTNNANSYIFNEEDTSVFRRTIEEYAKELRENIKEILAKSSQITQELDSKFPRLLFDQKNGIEEDDFKKRFDKVKEIQKSLSEYEIFDINKDDSHPTYDKENSKALYVYIDHAEKKLAVFSELLEKLKIFTLILNERRFSFKKIAISKENGFKFTTDQGNLLQLSELSSGEQQEVVLLYELLFKVKAGTLVLIDEPELSLHVVWQKQFLDDLFKIIDLRKINIVIATHSPQIINGNWNLTIDLEDLRNASASN